jgi:hypothetical protein
MKIPKPNGYYEFVAKNREAMRDHDRKRHAGMGPIYPLLIAPGLVGVEFEGMILSNESMTKLAEWLGTDGISFFKEMKQKHGRIDAVFMEGRIPHPVHFREGMRVRNFLRSLDECKDWGAHKLDDNWVDIIEDVIS